MGHLLLVPPARGPTLPEMRHLLVGGTINNACLWALAIATWLALVFACRKVGQLEGRVQNLEWLISKLARGEKKP